MPGNKISTNFEKGLGKIFEDYFSVYLENHSCDHISNNLYSLVLKEIEKPLLTKLMEKLSWNQKKTAEILGINRNTLRKKIHDLGIKLPN